MDGFLLRTHSAVAVQTKLANTTAIFSLYLRHLSHGARRNLWLVQSAGHSSLTGLPVEPATMFGSGALTMIQWAQEARRYANELSGPLAYPQRSRRPSPT